MSKALVVRQEAFDDTHLQVIEHQGEEWFTAEDIGKALGFADPRDAITKIYRRNRDEFVELSVTTRLGATDGKKYQMRIFNLQAVQKIGFFADTPRAKAFRHWASNLLAHGIHQMRDHILQLEAQLSRSPAALSPSCACWNMIDQEAKIKTLTEELQRTHPLALPAPTVSIPFEISSKIGHSLNHLKALGDTIVNLGMAGNQASLLDNTLENLGLLIIEKVEKVKAILKT